MKTLFLAGLSLIIISISFTDNVLDSTDTGYTTPRLPQPGEFSIWDDGSPETGWAWYYTYCDLKYDGWGKLCLANQDWAIGENLFIDSIIAAESTK